ncbi:MAG TPA: cbb3-type cytochrome c oxidase subunit II [Gemmataceae bacterium]|nr:cbb3-type cytochrome c oxidase subunit II [Gemmataceae bacterium]
MFETKSGVLLIAGIGFFFLAFLSNGLVAWLMYAHLPEKTVEQMIQEQVDNPNRSQNVMTYFRDLQARYPEAFKKHYGEPTQEKCAEALRVGRKIYIGEGCWHCHSQFVRPVSNEEKRWGPVSSSVEYQNELQRPVMFGTRRVGPDLIREGGRHTNDWHIVHFFRPRLTSPQSVMPDYPWFFEKKMDITMGDGTRYVGPGDPNRRGIAIITYMQFLSSWLDTYPLYTSRDAPFAEGEQR